MIKNSPSNTLFEDKFILILLLAYTFLLLFTCSKMSPLYPINEWSDVNLYFNIGKGMFNGKVIYAEAFDHKGPLIFLIYGVGYLISDTSFLGVFIIQCICWSVMSIYIYRMARLFLDHTYALIVAFLTLTMILTKTEQGGSAEEFILICEAVSLFYLIKYFKEAPSANFPHPAKWMLIHGAMFSLTFFIKLNLAIFWFFPVILIGIDLLMHKEYKAFGRNILAFLIGVALVAAPVLLYFIVNGALFVAYDTYITLNFLYSGMASFGQTMEFLIVRFYQQFRFDFINFMVAFIGATLFPLLCTRKWIFRIALTLAFFSSYFVVFCGQGYVQYYSLAYYLFIIPGLIAIGYHLNKYIKLTYIKHICLLFFLAILCIGINKKNFFGMSREVICRKEKPDDLNNRFGEIIAKEQTPTLMNVNNDLGNVLFTSQQIMPNVRYFITPNIRYEMNDEMKQAQMGYVREGKTQFIILNDKAINYQFIIDMPELTGNYACVDSISDTSGNYYLFKQKY